MDGRCDPKLANYVADYGVWRSLVSRLFWEQEIVGSNPATPIEKKV